MNKYKHTWNKWKSKGNKKKKKSINKEAESSIKTSNRNFRTEKEIKNELNNGRKETEERISELKDKAIKLSDLKNRDK